MQIIVAPIDRQEPANNRVEVVHNLQDALLLLLRQHVLQVSAQDFAFYEQGLVREQAQQVFNDITERVVAVLQGQFRDRFQLQVNGRVDGSTADALNSLLREHG